MAVTDTIFAVATGVGRAAIVVIRLSGSRSGGVVAALAGCLPAPRLASVRRLRDVESGAVLDEALVLWFPGPASFTGEDAAELHLHGGRAVVAAVVAALGAQPGCRLAEPGEFTRRAFLNGRLDLAEVEGLADLIEAETEAQRRQALTQMEGALGAWVATMREALLNGLAAAESAIDFSDEADVAGDFAREVQACAGTLLGAVRDQLAQAGAARRIREGLVVALCGPPNAGKSTLLNALAHREVAIVSPFPGTTRDPIAVRLDLDGYLVELVDTAGLRPTDDPIEREGVTRALARAKEADIILWLSNIRAIEAPPSDLGGAAIWRVATKSDLGNASSPVLCDYALSAKNGDGLPALIDALKTAAGAGLGDDAGVITRERHRKALRAAEQGLTALVAGAAERNLELAAEQLRFVALQLDSLVGRIEAEDVLGAIFSRFCIGK